MWPVIVIALIVAVFWLFLQRAKAKNEIERKRYEAEQSYQFDEANVTGFHKKLERFGK